MAELLGLERNSSAGAKRVHPFLPLDLTLPTLVNQVPLWLLSGLQAYGVALLSSSSPSPSYGKFTYVPKVTRKHANETMNPIDSAKSSICIDLP